jgi:hypothetical protein
MPSPITRNIINDDLSGRFVGTSVVVASPALAAETIIASLTLPNFGDTPIVAGVRLHGWAAFTVGTSGSAATLKIHQTNASGSTVVSSGALSVTAANLVAFDVLGADAAPGKGIYVLTLQITAGGDESTVSAVHLSATMV